MWEYLLHFIVTLLLLVVVVVVLWKQKTRITKVNINNYKCYLIIIKVTECYLYNTRS